MEFGMGGGGCSAKVVPTATLGPLIGRRALATV